MSAKPTARIYDRNRLIGGTAAASRTKASCVWGKRNGFEVVDEHVAWGAAADLPRPPELVEAVQACAAEGSTLIVYSDDVLGNDPDTVRWVREATGVLLVHVKAKRPTDVPS